MFTENAASGNCILQNEGGEQTSDWTENYVRFGEKHPVVCKQECKA